ncbi:MAG: hypothetical protein IPG45_17120 [Deltaproteobacteria bacterium]|nr:hypothetical protein [Deltaproteobacteria bacterium]
MSQVEQKRVFTQAIIQSVGGLERLNEAQQKRLDRAIDVDGNGQVSYLEEFGGASAFISSNYSQRNPCQGQRLAPGVSAEGVVKGLEQRKAAISAIAAQFADQTFDQGRATGTTARYFGGFFNSSTRTLKDEIRDIAHKMRGFGQLEQLQALVDATPRNDAGKIDFKIWDAHLYGALQAKLGVQPMGRLLHGSQWGDL